MKQTSHTPLFFWRRLYRGMVAACLIACLLPVGGSISAQSGGRASITAPDLSQFPTVTFFLNAFDETGAFIDDLRPADIGISEDGQNVPAASLEKMEPGLQVVIAFNNAPSLANYYGTQSRFQGVQSALLAWLQTQGGTSSNDNLSLLSNSGLFLTRSSNPQEWAPALQNFAPDLNNTMPGIGSLSQALDMGVDPLPRENMKRVILYITVLPDASTTAALPNLTARARQQNTRVFVWVVAPGELGDQAGYQALTSLALSTGGQIFQYSAQNSLPDLENYFAPLRYLYRVSYLSLLRQSGDYRLSVSLKQPERQIEAGSQAFSLDLRPPNPIFISPPSQLQRAWTAPVGDEDAVLTPPNLDLRILVEFPDRLTRDLAYTRLLVDGQVVDENTSAPFDSLSWDLSDVTASGQHTLQVRAGDQLGLSGQTIEVQVSVQVPPAPKRSLWQIIRRQKNLPLYGGIAVAGLALLLALIFAGRRIKRRPAAARDPLTQPVPIRQEKTREKPRPGRTPRVLQRNVRAPAQLVRQPRADAHPSPEPEAPADLPLIERETTFGSDPRQAMVALDSASVSGLHARIQASSDGKYTLADAGSVAGTWVNYAPVSQQGARLEHGDLVHIGGLAYRFVLTHPPKPRQPRSEPQDEEL